MKHRRVLVTGATGAVGRHIVAGLRDVGVTVRALTRQPDLAGLPADVELAVGDLTDPSSLEPAVKDVDAVFLLWPSFSPGGAAEAVEVLARGAGRIVYLSAMNVRDDQTPERNGVWGAVEQLVERSGVRWTFLRVGGFATNTLEWADQTRVDDVVRIPFPAAGRSLIHERDIAAVAVRVLLDEGHDGQKYVLTGQEALTQLEQVRVIGEAIVRPLLVEELTPDQARRQAIERWGDATFVDAALDYWATLVDAPEQVTNTVAELTGAPPLTFREWAADHADDFRALSTAEVAERYVGAFRAGRINVALGLLAPDVVRIAPMEYDEPLRGVADIMANSREVNADFEIRGVDISEPLLADTQFAVRFAFDERSLSTGQQTVTTKISLYTVTNGRISREEVFYRAPRQAV